MAQYFYSEPSIDIYLTPGWYPVVWQSTPTFELFWDQTGVRPYSHRDILVPVLQTTYNHYVGQTILANNAHGDPSYGPAIDQALSCAESQLYPESKRLCMSISRPIPMPYPTYVNYTIPPEDVMSTLFQPVWLHNPTTDADTVVGFVGGTLSWKAVLQTALPSFVSAFDCVITMKARSIFGNGDGVGEGFTAFETKFTYSLVKGQVVFRGMTDLHDVGYDSFKR
ncbi:hypothetical protein B484DRAFT_253470 [Ochromonadaceae sp. CCMP2298]|nr:hypothetical protein B484DRAFT_253470 [Ochromonadaceae sp. CCMP2298]